MSKYNRFNSLKVMAHAKKIDAIIKGRMPSPVEWVIYPSNYCSYKCGHCIMAVEKSSFRDSMPERTMRKIPHDARKMGIKTVIFSGGGDPLLNPMTMEIARELKDTGISVGLNNQGYLLHDASAFNFVRFSVDAATKETYNSIHRYDGWDQINENIGKARQCEGVEIGLAFLITPTNYHEIEAFCEWGSKFKPDFMHIRPAFLDADYLEKHYPDGDLKLRTNIMPLLIPVQNRIEALYDNVYFRVDKFDGYWTQKAYSKCRSTPLMAVTAADGSFVVCQDKFMRWGNYNKDSFEDIWYSEDHQKVIDDIDLSTCPRCVEAGYNEIIEKVFIDDGMKLNLL